VRGRTEFENALLDDLVIARADGNTGLPLGRRGRRHGRGHHPRRPRRRPLLQHAKHVRIYEALGADVPVYAHLRYSTDRNGKKLSKRHGAASVQDLRDSGYLKEAVVNYLALLGWGYDESTTFFSIPELQKLFSLERVSKAPAVFDEQKLRWVTAATCASSRSTTDGAPGGLHRPHRASRAVAITQDKISTLSEFWPLAGSFFDGPFDDPSARQKFLSTPDNRAALEDAKGALEQVSRAVTPENVESALRGVVERTSANQSNFFSLCALALTGDDVSPGIFETVALLGRDEGLQGWEMRSSA